MTTKPNPDAAIDSDQSGKTQAGPRTHAPHSPDELEDYAGGYIQAHHGRINGWLVVVIVVLIVWAIYYGFTYWGGLGDGLDY